MKSSPGRCHRCRLISTARGLVVCRQITVHTRLQLQIRPHHLTKPLCGTDGSDDKTKWRKKAKSSSFFFHMVTHPRLNRWCPLGSESTDDSSAQYFVDVSWAQGRWNTALLTKHKAATEIEMAGSLHALHQHRCADVTVSVLQPSSILNWIDVTDFCAARIPVRVFIARCSGACWNFPRPSYSRQNIWGASETKV